MNRSYEQPWRDIEDNILRPGQVVIVGRSSRYGGSASVSKGKIERLTKYNVTMTLDGDDQYLFTTPYAPNKFYIVEG